MYNASLSNDKWYQSQPSNIGIRALQLNMTSNENVRNLTGRGSGQHSKKLNLTLDESIVHAFYKY